MENKEQKDETSKMIKLLDWTYEKVLNGFPGAKPLDEFANEFKTKTTSLEDNVNSLINWQISKTATTGFIAGLGGLITLPISIPADITTGVYVNMRMIAAIAHLGGYNVKDDKVKTLVYICLTGETLKDTLKDFGINVGVKFAQNFMNKIPGKLLTKINHRIGFRFVTKFGTKGSINLIKIVPVVGGIIGGSMNALATKTFGRVAKNIFINDKTDTDSFIIDVESEVIENPDLELIKFYTYINLIKIDNRTTNEEHELFEYFINNSLLYDNMKTMLIQKLNSKEMIEVDYSSFKNSPNNSIQFFENLIKMAKIDNDLHFKEKIFIKNIGKEIGFSDEDIKEMITSQTIDP